MRSVEDVWPFAVQHHGTRICSGSVIGRRFETVLVRTQLPADREVRLVAEKDVRSRSIRASCSRFSYRCRCRNRAASARRWRLASNHDTGTSTSTSHGDTEARRLVCASCLRDSVACRVNGVLASHPGHSIRCSRRRSRITRKHSCRQANSAALASPPDAVGTRAHDPEPALAIVGRRGDADAVRRSVRRPRAIAGRAALDTHDVACGPMTHRLGPAPGPFKCLAIHLLALTAHLLARRRAPISRLRSWQRRSR